MFFIAPIIFSSMKKGIFVICISLVSISTTIAQKTYYAAVAPTVWGTPTSWDVGAIGAGQDGTTPGAGDDVYTNGFTVVVTGGAQSCRNLFVDDAFANSLLMGSQLTITGTMISWSTNYFGFFFPFQQYPTVPSIVGGAPIVFTGANVNTNGVTFADEVISYWNSTAPIPTATFNFGTGVTRTIANIGSEAFFLAGFTPGDLRVTNAFTLTSGILSFDQSTMLRMQVGNVLTVTSGTLNVNLPFTQTSSNTSLIPTINNSSRINLLDTDSYLNGANVNLNAGSTLNVGFSGANQSEGWWYQSNKPTTPIIGPTSLVTYNSTNTQNIFSTTYGDLIITDGGAGVAKQLVGLGSLSTLGDVILDGAATFIGNDNDMNIDGGLLVNGTISSNNTSTRHLTIGGNYVLIGSTSTLGQPTEVIFDGAADQSISGSGTISFDDVTISNMGGIVSLNNEDIDVNGIFDIDLGATFNPDNNKVNLAGNLIIDGTLTASGTFEFDGATEVSGGGSASFNDVIITNTLSAPSNPIAVAGDFTNNGTYDNVNGTVEFNGVNPQSISGNPTDFNNLIINSTDGTSGVTLSSTATLLNKLTLSSASAKFNAGTDLLTLSSATVNSNARIGALPIPANFTGSVIIERYVESPAEDWRYFSIPVDNGNLGMWADDFAVTGNFSDANNSNPNVLDPAAASVYSFNSGTQAWVAADGGGGTTASFGLGNTTGYSAWTYMNADFTIEVNGTIGKGDQSVSTVLGDNLIGNPYPAAIDWTTIFGVSTNLNNTVYIRTGNNVFASYSSGAGTGVGHPDVSWAGEISQGQAFWAIGSGAGSVAMTENSKTDNAIQHVRTSGPYNQFRVKLAGNDQVDETIVYFRDDATIGFEDQYDGHKKKNGSVVGCTICDHINLSTYNTLGDAPLVFNALPFGVTCNATSKLNIEDVPVGIYTLNFSDLETMEFGVAVTLVDNFLNKSITISNGDSYTFEVTGDVTSFGELRFELSFDAETVDPNPVYEYQNSCDDVTVVSIIDSQLGVSYSISSNAEIIASGIGNGEELAINISSSVLSVGINLLDLSLNNNGCSDVTLPEYISVDIMGKEEITNVTNGLSCGTGNILLKAEGATSNSYYRWYESLDAMEPILDQNSNEYLTPEIDVTKFYYVSVVNGVGCESLIRAKVIAEVVNVSQPDILLEGDVISTTAVADSYQWYNNGELLEGETIESITPTESGVYSVEITTNTCSVTSENLQHIILGIKELKEIGLEIYPNPVVDNLIISSNRLIINSISIYDTKGIEIIRFDDDIPSEINMSTMKKGIYIINIVTDTKTITSRVRKK